MKESIQYLYKYGRINQQCEERSERLFTTPSLWFSSPAELNDPFECKPWVTGDGTREQVLDLRHYPVELLAGVIFGARISSADRAKIRGWLRQRGHSVRLYEAIQSERHFKVEIRLVE